MTSRSPKPLEQRAAEMKSRQMDVVKYHPRYTDNDVRRARLKFIREKIGKTQIEFAAMLGVTYRTYSNVEYGEVTCTKTYMKLAETLLHSFRTKEYSKRKAEKLRIEANLAASGIKDGDQTV